MRTETNRNDSEARIDGSKRLFLIGAYREREDNDLIEVVIKLDFPFRNGSHVP